jgi:acyl-CoA dehydrogenase
MARWKNSALCTNDWDITHVRADLPPDGLGVPQAQHKLLRHDHPEAVRRPRLLGAAHSRVIAEAAPAISSTLSSTVGVPNSLGPGELLLHYGTDEQKNHYLPRLADGREIPCFALTGPHAGSDATSIPTTASSARANGTAPRCSACA